MELTEKQRPLPPAGTHTGTLYKIIDLGTQYNEAFGNKQRKVDFLFELPDELMEDGKPFSASKRYTLSLSEKAQIMKDLRSWMGEAPKKGYNPAERLGKSANITISHDTAGNGKTYANITAISPLKKGEKLPKPVNEQVVFDLDDYKEVIFQKLPEFYKDMIKESPEYQNLGKEPAPDGYKKPGEATDNAEAIDDEIPF